MYPRLKELREEKELNQKIIADVLNISQTTYSRYEIGELDIPSQSLIALALYHETSIDYLVGLTDNPDAYKRSKSYINKTPR